MAGQLRLRRRGGPGCGAPRQEEAFHHLDTQCVLGRMVSPVRLLLSVSDEPGRDRSGPLWKRYIQLTEAEWAFRIATDELVIRPIWHHKEDRVLAHILVCFLAHVLWKTLTQRMHRSGLGNAPRTLVEEFAKIKSGDVVPPAVCADGGRRTIRLRCVTTPDAPRESYSLGWV